VPQEHCELGKTSLFNVLKFQIISLYQTSNSFTQSTTGGRKIKSIKKLEHLNNTLEESLFFQEADGNEQDLKRASMAKKTINSSKRIYHVTYDFRENTDDT